MKKRMLCAFIASMVILTGVAEPVMAMQDNQATAIEEVTEVMHETEEVTASEVEDIKETETEAVTLIEESETESEPAAVAEEKETEAVTSELALEAVSSGDGWSMDDKGVLTVSTQAAMNSKEWRQSLGDLSSIKAVIVEEGITGVSAEAFLECENISSVKLPNSLKSIDNQAFSVAKSLGEIKLPDGLQSIGWAAFEYCDFKGTDLVLPGSLTSIANGAFQYTEGIKNITFADGSATTLTMGDGAFKQSKITGKVILPARLKVVPDEAFSDSTLSDLQLSEGIEVVNRNAFDSCSKLKALVCPSTLTTIKSSGFYGCDELASITLNEGLTTIEDSAFWSIGVLCPDNSKFDLIIPSTVKNIGTSAFARDVHIGNLEFRNGTNSELTLGENVFEKTAISGRVTLPTRLKTIPYKTFFGCQMNELIMPVGIETIGQTAFALATVKNRFTFPTSLRTIEEEGFLESYIGPIELNDGLENIGGAAFSAAKIGESIEKPSKLIIPATVKYVGQEAFANIFEINEVEFLNGSNTELTLGIGVFEATRFVNKIILPSRLKEIPAALASGAILLQDVYIPAGVTKIESDAFANIEGVNIHGTNPSAAYEFYKYMHTEGGWKDNYKWFDWEPKKPVSITVNPGKTSYDYDGSPIDITETFIYDSNCGDKEFSLLAGSGTLTKDGKLTITKAGDFTIEVKTGIKGEYDEGIATANITVTVSHPLTVTFNSNGGTAVDSITGIVPGVSISEPASPIRAGYRFIGWYQDAEGTLEWKFESAEGTNDGDKVTGDLTLFAKWKDRTQVAKPYTDETSTEVEKNTKIRLYTGTIDAKILYTVDGSTPVIGGATTIEYVDEIAITSPTTINAIAVKEGLKDSDLFSVTFSIKNTAEDWGDVLIPDRAGFDDADAIPDGIWFTGVPESVTYSGNANTFLLHVYDGKTRLVEKTDYTVAYRNNTKAADKSAVNGSGKSIAPTVVVTGKGTYTGKQEKTFTIEPLDIGSEAITVADLCVKGTGKEIKPAPVVKYGVTTLRKGTDYTIETESGNLIDGGTHILRLVGGGNYTGSRTIKLDIVYQNARVGFTVDPVKSQEYTGENITPDIVVKKNREPMAASAYTVKFYNNKEVGTATAVVTVDEEVKIVTFKITGKLISATTIEGIADKQYTSYPQEQTSYTIKDKKTGKPLEKGKDYDIYYLKNTDVGTASIVFVGKNGYSGQVKRNFKINAASFTSDKVDISCAESAVYAKGGAKPDIKVTYKDGSGEVRTLIEGVEYTVTYANNKKVGSGIATATVKGKGNFKELKKYAYSVTKADISKLTMLVKDKAFTGKPGTYKTTFTITDVDGKNLAGTDYDAKSVKYYYAEDMNLADGTEHHEGDEVGVKDVLPAETVVQVSVKAKDGGNYTGEISATYKINRLDINKVTMTIDKKDYTGSRIKPGKSDIKIKNGVISATDYEIIGYGENIKKGTGSVTV
ncbi:MAG: leucine-rich repeat protein, partial [Lachnospiraceae bacterium]|nr:leucine-rich repeat protein [Candidatus Colinaster scatohippi]